jgi:hypothetical protein
MPTGKDRSSTPSTRSHLPSRVFAPEYLAYLAQRDEPESAPEADTAGPWHDEPHPDGFAVLREGESVAKGHEPAAVFLRRELALLTAAGLPGTGRRLRFRLSPDPDAHGFPILLEGRQVGHMRYFDEELLAVLNVLDSVVSSPHALALLLDAIGGLALEHLETIAVARLEAAAG